MYRSAPIVLVVIQKAFDLKSIQFWIKPCISYLLVEQDLEQEQEQKPARKQTDWLEFTSVKGIKVVSIAITMVAHCLHSLFVGMYSVIWHLTILYT